MLPRLSPRNRLAGLEQVRANECRNRCGYTCCCNPRAQNGSVERAMHGLARDPSVVSWEEQSSARQLVPVREPVLAQYRQRTGRQRDDPIAATLRVAYVSMNMPRCLTLLAPASSRSICVVDKMSGAGRSTRICRNDAVTPGRWSVTVYRKRSAARCTLTVVSANPRSLRKCRRYPRTSSVPRSRGEAPQ